MGQMPFLYVIGLLQKAERLGTNVDNPAGRWLMGILDIYLRPGYPPGINCWDPWLFGFAIGSRDDQEKFYIKVWTLYRRLNTHIFVLAVGQLATLRLIEPDFLKLEIRITFDLDAGGAGETRTLTRNDVEGDSYNLPAIPSPPLSPSPGENSDCSDEGSCCSDGCC